MKRMKKLSLFLPAILLLTLVFVNYSCETVDEEQCESEETCEADFIFCSSENSYYYQFSGEEYYCETPFVDVETSCKDAMTDLMADMCKNKVTEATQVSMILKTQKLMDQILLSVSL